MVQSRRSLRGQNRTPFQGINNPLDSTPDLYPYGQQHRRPENERSMRMQGIISNSHRNLGPRLVWNDDMQGVQPESSLIDEEAETEDDGYDEDMPIKSICIYPDSLIEVKIEAFAQLFRQCSWSFAKFLHHWTAQNSVTTTHRSFRTHHLRRKHFVHAIQVQSPEFDILGTSHTFSSLEGELNNLIEMSPLFGRFELDKPITDFDYSAAEKDIYQIAPKWNKLLVRLTQNHRAYQDSYTHITNIELSKKIRFMLTSMICHARAPRRSSLVANTIGIYLKGCGIKRAVIETLQGFGVCLGYTAINQLHNRLANKCRKDLKIFGSDPQGVICYDNINFMDRKRDERLGHRATMQNLTTATLILCPFLPLSGLTQDMRNLQYKIYPKTILHSPGVSGIGSNLRYELIRYHLLTNFVRMHPSLLAILGHTHPLLQFPKRERLPINKTQYWQFGAIHANEGTLAGTYKVHEYILQQLGILPEDLELLTSDDVSLQLFREKLKLFHGDQLTASFIRSLKRHQAQAGHPFDQRRWMEGIIAWFHTNMSALNTLVRTHWDVSSPSEKSLHTIRHDVQLWNRSSFGTPNNVKYHLAAPLIAQGFAGRTLAIFYDHLKRENIHDFDKDPLRALVQLESSLSRMTANKLLEIIDHIFHSVFVRENYINSADHEFVTMCKYLDIVQMFLSLNQAVKYGDIGILDELVDPLIIQFIGAGQYRYGYDMLHYRWLLRSANPQLRYAILASGIVNWQGLPTTHKAIDLAQEHLNASAKLDMRNFKNSTHDIDKTFDRVCLTNTWMKNLRHQVESQFGERMSGRHSTRSADSDIALLAIHIFNAGLSSPRSSSALPPAGSMFIAKDIIQIGTKLLEDKFGKDGVYTGKEKFTSEEDDIGSIQEMQNDDDDDRIQTGSVLGVEIMEDAAEE